MKTVLAKNETKILKALDIALAKSLVKNAILKEETQNLFDFSSVKTRFLDRLAKSFRIEYWDSNWNEKEKRDFLKLSLLLNLFAGSRWAVEKIVQIFFKEALVEEWYKNPSINRFYLHIKIPKLLASKDSENLMLLLSKYKAVHTHIQFVFSRFLLFSLPILFYPTTFQIKRPIAPAKRERYLFLSSFCFLQITAIQIKKIKLKGENNAHSN